MIHDKDYMMRQIQQFSEFLAKLNLGNNEGAPEEIELVIETQLRNIFKTDPETMLKKSKNEIIDIVSQKDEPHQASYYEMLAHLFFLEFKKSSNLEFAENAKTFYEIWSQKSGVFSLPVMGRITELNAALIP